MFISKSCWCTIWEALPYVTYFRFFCKQFNWNTCFQTFVDTSFIMFNVKLKSSFGNANVPPISFHSVKNALLCNCDVQNKDTVLLFYITHYLPSPTPAHRNEMGIYKSPQRPFFAREFPTSWRGINRGARFKSQWKENSEVSIITYIM